MNALTVLCLAAAVASSTCQLVAYPQVYGYPGVLGAYPGFLPPAAPITLKTVAPAPITYKTVAAKPITIKAASPVTYNVAPVAPVAPIAPVQSRFHAQDELGQYSFGYAGGPASRAETRDAFGIVRGSYNYVDSEGKLQTQHYVADALGFRVSGTNLPVAPAAPEAPALVGPEPVQDTPEVAAAKASFRSLLEQAAAAPEAPETPEPVEEPVPEAAAESTAVSRKKRAVVAAPAVFPYASPLRFSYGYTAPLTYSHPLAYSGAFPAVAPYTGIPVATTYTAAAPAAVKDATLLRVVHNPGHAVSYRVD